MDRAGAGVKPVAVLFGTVPRGDAEEERAGRASWRRTPELVPLHSVLSQETGAPGRATHLRTLYGRTLSSWGQGGNPEFP